MTTKAFLFPRLPLVKAKKTAAPPLDPPRGTTREETQKHVYADAETFTTYVKALSEQHSGLDALFEGVWTKLRQMLARELRRRSLWTGSPALVGLIGWESWSAVAEGPGQTAGPLEELLPDCYTEIFHVRLPVLISQLRVNEGIDALVSTFVRQFLSERQQIHDPLGSRIFKMLRVAVRTAVSARELFVLRGRKSIVNSTVLGASEKANPDDTATVDDLRPIVERWNHDLLPGLITAQRAERRQVLERLGRFLFHLESDGVTVFRFKDLVNPMKQDVRGRWGALYESEVGEVHKQPAKGEDEEERGAIRALIRVFRPQFRIEEVESYRKLVACVTELLDRVEASGRTPQYLDVLWTFMRRFSLDDDAGDLPSHTKVGKELKIPRERLPELYGMLGKLLRQCQERLMGGKVVEIGSRRPPGGRHE